MLTFQCSLSFIVEFSTMKNKVSSEFHLLASDGNPYVISQKLKFLSAPENSTRYGKCHEIFGISDSFCF